jgi:Protein of unknown function (DUF3108)
MLLAAHAAVALSAPAISPASAQGKLDAQYSVTLAGIPIGKGDWVIDIADTQYTATANGRTTGLLRAFSSGEGTSVAHGTMQGGKLMSSIFSSVVTAGKKKDETRLTTANGNIKDVFLEPPEDPDTDRVPLTEAHRHGVLDPMTASLLYVAGTGDPMSPEACKRTTSIYDGRLRYDLQLVYKRMDKVKADKGYDGPAMVCAVYFTPVAGYIPTRSAIKYIAKLREIEIWLVPIAGTRVLVPFRIDGPTPIGHAVMEATQFVSVAVPTRAANGSKSTQ